MNIRHSIHPVRCSLAVAVAAAMLPMAAWGAPKVEFDAGMLFGGAHGAMDLSRYEQGGILPGTYVADVLVNGSLVGRRDIVVRASEAEEANICLDAGLFDLMGLDQNRLDALRESGDGAGRDLLPLPSGETCQALSAFVPGASSEFDVGAQTLKLSIPQLYLARNPRGWVDPALWESGITAATLAYNINHSRQRYQGQEASSTSMTVDAGLNLGEWRLRHSGYLYHADGVGTSYSAGRSFLQRNLPRWGAQLTLGEASTQGDMLQSVSYRGVNISSDPRMLPDGVREYAPVVRGVAQTNAKVTIRQRGYVIHETTVAPGPFEIDDLNSTGSSGDIEVEVTEADGRVERFTIPFTAMPQLLRPGQQRFSVTAGQLRDAAHGSQPNFVEATLRRGLSNQFTGYAGATAAEGYSSVVLGAAWSTPIGAFSGDVTFSDARLPGDDFFASERRRGQSYRVAFNKALFSNNTNITLAAYRYSTSDFLSLQDAVRLRAEDAQGGYDSHSRQRSRLDLTVNQRLGDGKGTLNFTGSTTDYWSENRRRTTFSAGYSNRLGRGSYSISARRTQESMLFSSGPAKTTNSVYLSFSMPLGTPRSAPRLDTSYDRDSTGRHGERLGLYGSLGEQSLGNYNVSVARNDGGTSYGVGANYQLPRVHLTGSYDRTGSNSQLSLGASGAMVLHGGGLTLGQHIGETVGLVHIPGAKDAVIGTMTDVRTDSRGYAIVPYLSPFRRNELNVDPSNLPLDVELSAGSVSAIPNAGAVVKMVLPTLSGRSALIEALLADGVPLPFGTDVMTADGDVVGVVGQGSRLWVRGIEEQGELFVRYGAAEHEQCRIAYDLRDVASGELVMSRCRDGDSEQMAARD
ncbi:fimbrial biogenesis outer membrane usher protein [Stenotrophomonas maltophilia]|nr:fimbrial biogenesis outer membrane usher protein [Stenotrophomonas maltophilia]